MSWRRFFAKPAEAFAQVTAAIPPQEREATAMTVSRMPRLMMKFISTPSCILFTRSAVIKGIKHSITASKRINKKVSSDGSLYSLTLLASLSSIFTILSKKKRDNSLGEVSETSPKCFDQKAPKA